jgi:intracellular sulfur oxidation DsrE/DsrF family protein
MNAVQVAEMVENHLHQTLESNEYDPFHLTHALVYGVSLGDKGEISIENIAKNYNVYELLDDDESAVVASGYAYTMLVTCGWASPLPADEIDSEADVPPSKHPERRRVRIAVVANRESVASVLRFQDDKENTMLDEGLASGSLAEAFREFVTFGVTKTD